MVDVQHPVNPALASMDSPSGNTGPPDLPRRMSRSRLSSSASSTQPNPDLPASSHPFPPSRSSSNLSSDARGPPTFPQSNTSGIRDRSPSESTNLTPHAQEPSQSAIRPSPSLASTSNLNPPPTIHPKSARTPSATPSSSSRRLADSGKEPVLPKFVKNPVLVDSRPWSSSIPASTSTGLYSYQAPIHGQPPPPLKAHTATLVGDCIWIIGGTLSSGGCFRGLATFNIYTMEWSLVRGISGELPPPLRAHTATAVGDSIFVVGGGDGLQYYNDVWRFDTTTLTWSLPPLRSKPTPANAPPTLALPDRPPRRRAHSASLWGSHKICIFGGGNGDRALNDTWIYDAKESYWEKVECQPSSAGHVDSGRREVVLPPWRGYHTSTCADDKLIVLGGSDGSQSFSSIDVLDLKTNVWHRLDRTLDNAPVSRAFHSTVLVGNSLFAVGGHDGKSYAKDILAFDFRRRTWSTKKVGGKLPTPERGYHSSTYADGRIFIFGGSDGSAILGDLWIVELGSLAVLGLESTVSLDFD